MEQDRDNSEQHLQVRPEQADEHRRFDIAKRQMEELAPVFVLHEPRDQRRHGPTKLADQVA